MDFLSSGRRLSATAFTLVEMSIALGIVSLLTSLIYSFWTTASASTGKSVDHSEALRSTLVASEYIRNDLAQLLYNFPSRDLELLADGTGVGMRVPRVLDRTNMWTNRFEPVQYRLRPHPSGSGFGLVRTDETGATPLSSCHLAGLHIIKVPPGGLGRIDFLQVTMVGQGDARGRVTFAASVVMPLIPRYPPVPYRRDATGRIK